MESTEATQTTEARCDHAGRQTSRSAWFYCIYPIGHTGNHRHVKRVPSDPRKAKP